MQMMLMVTNMSKNMNKYPSKTPSKLTKLLVVLVGYCSASNGSKGECVLDPIIMHIKDPTRTLGQTILVVSKTTFPVRGGAGALPLTGATDLSSTPSLGYQLSE